MISALKANEGVAFEGNLAGFCTYPVRRAKLGAIGWVGVASENGKNRTLRVCKRLQQPDLTSFIASSSARHNSSQIAIFLTLLENGRF